MMIWDQDQKVKVVKEKEKAKVKETGMMKTGKVNGKNQKVKVTGETGKTKKKVTGRNLKVVKVKAKVKVEKVKVAKVKAAKEKKKTPSITSKKVMNNKDSEEDQDQVDLKKAQKSMFTNGRVTILVNTLLKNNQSL